MFTRKICAFGQVIIDVTPQSSIWPLSEEARGNEDMCPDGTSNYYPNNDREISTYGRFAFP